jgi:hypothetical protein
LVFISHSASHCSEEVESEVTLGDALDGLGLTILEEGPPSPLAPEDNGCRRSAPVGGCGRVLEVGLRGSTAMSMSLSLLS